MLVVVGVDVGRARANSSARARAGGGLERLHPVLLLLLGLHLLFPLGFLKLLDSRASGTASCGWIGMAAVRSNGLPELVKVPSSLPRTGLR